MKLAVIGGGAWGSALAELSALNGVLVTVWDQDPSRLARWRAPRVGAAKESVAPVAVDTLSAALDGAECVIVAVPSSVMRKATLPLSAYGGIVVSVTKGIEFETGLTMSGVLEQTAPRASIAALSGPTLATEVAKGVPTAAVVASEDPDTALRVQSMLHRPSFRLYTGSDLVGVELGGALKNVIAVAAGICDGLGFGDNTKAALVTRGVVEMRRLGVACGAKAETFSGLSGLGDLVATCASKLSRNRTLGERLGRGESLQAALELSAGVAEGHPTARAAKSLARQMEVSTPIIDEVYNVLYEAKPVRSALEDLLARSTKAED